MISGFHNIYPHEAAETRLSIQIQHGDEGFEREFTDERVTWYKEYRGDTYLEGHLCDSNLP